MHGKTLRPVTEYEKKTWNDFITTHGGSFLQSWEWGSLQKQLGRRIWHFGSKRAAVLIIEHQLRFGKRYLYAPRGPVIIREHPEDVRRIIELVKQKLSKGTIFFRIEPVSVNSHNAPFIARTLRSLGFVTSPPAQPESTILLDLTLSEKELMKKLKYETRYAVRTAIRRGVTVTKAAPEELTSAFEIFWDLFSKTNARHGLAAYPKPYYKMLFKLTDGCAVSLFIARLGEKPLSAAIIIHFGGTAVYLYSASDSGYGRYNAPTLLLWEAIMNAKSLGCATFDFWGASNDNPRWAGITAYKKRFGGSMIRYAGTWNYVFNKPWYALYRTLKTILRH